MSFIILCPLSPRKILVAKPVHAARIQGKKLCDTERSDVLLYARSSPSCDSVSGGLRGKDTHGHKNIWSGFVLRATEALRWSR